MTIWIFAVVVVAALALAGWRQGAIRAAFYFVDILLAALLAAPLGRLLHPLLPHLGASNPLTAWALAPIAGFIVASIPLMIGAQFVHHRVEHFYKYRAGDLREALYRRLNARLGICLGVLNGVVYFILISFFIFNLTYATTQVSADPANQPFLVRAANSLGDGLADSGFGKTASAVGTLRPEYYQLADLAGLLMQNPPLGQRFADYPGLVSLWHREELQPLVNDSTLVRAPSTGASLGQIMGEEPVQTFLANKSLTKMVEDALLTNLDDLVPYLKTGKSAKYGNEPILGNWEFNAGVTLAWFRQEQPKMARNELLAIRALWSEAYAPTKLLLTGDNQIFVKGFPKFGPPAQQNGPPFQGEDWKGDWTREGANYSLHLTLNGQDKYLNATIDGLRLRVKDGHNLLIFDHVN